MAAVVATGSCLAADSAEAPPNPQRDCRITEPDACLKLAQRWDRGAKGPRDTTKARRYYAVACQGGNPVACNSLGAMVMRDEGAGLTPNLAFTLFVEACRRGNPHGCLNAAVCYEWGTGIGQNFIEARSLYEKACAQGIPRACQRLTALKKWNWDSAVLRNLRRGN